MEVSDEQEGEQKLNGGTVINMIIVEKVDGFSVFLESDGKRYDITEFVTVEESGQEVESYGISGKP